MKFGVEDLLIMPLSSCEFCESQHSDCLILLGLSLYFCPRFSYLSSNLGENRHHEDCGHKWNYIYVCTTKMYEIFVSK